MRIIIICIASFLLSACPAAPNAKNVTAEETATPETPSPEGEPQELALAVIEQDAAGNIIETVAVVYGSNIPGDPQLSGGFENGQLIEVVICDTTTNPPTCAPIEATQDPTLEAEARTIILDIYQRLAPRALEEARRNYNNKPENIGTVSGITNTT